MRTSRGCRFSRRFLAVAAGALASLLVVAATQAAEPPLTLRLAIHHSGTAESEAFTLDGLRVEGPWPGPLHHPLDDTNLGEYRLEVRDAVSGDLLYSHGYATVFGEWRTTAEARSTTRTFHESLRIPMPDKPVDVSIWSRRPDGGFDQAWKARVDPADPSMDRSPLPAVHVWAVEEHGAPSEKLDLLLLGDGYTAAEMEKWHADARRLAKVLLAVSPYRERRTDINVWAIDTPADASGVSRPSDGIYRRSPIGATYDALGMERYILIGDDWQFRDIAAAAPYDALAVIVNDRKYGGGGIFGLYATVAADSVWAPYVFVHELGHHIAGLADEYFTSAVTYESGAARPEPWEPNVTADPHGSRWSDLITPGVPLPTPWPKEQYAKLVTDLQAQRARLRAQHAPEADVEKLFSKEQSLTTELLTSFPYAKSVGAFEGANYEADGYYRSQADCIMFSRNEVGFCAACRRAIERMIDFHSR